MSIGVAIVIAMPRQILEDALLRQGCPGIVARLFA